jgi:hypothetical protein
VLPATHLEADIELITGIEQTYPHYLLCSVFEDAARVVSSMLSFSFSRPDLLAKLGTPSKSGIIKPPRLNSQISQTGNLGAQAFSPSSSQQL